MSFLKIVLALFALLTLLVGCGGPATSAGGDDHEDHVDTPPTNRVDIPLAVRSNLGVTFVTVERRRVQSTLRAPGQFELLPSARREYRTMLSGRVELAVAQFDEVEPGTLLYSIDSTEWRALQQQLVETSSEIHRLRVRLGTFEPLEAAHARHAEGLHRSVAIWEERVAQLESVRAAGGGRVDALAEARATLAKTQSDLAEVDEKDAEVHASRAEAAALLEAARGRWDALLNSASTLCNLSVEELARASETGDRGRWSHIDRIEVRAVASGIVEDLGATNGAWVAASTAVVTVVQPDRLRFHALGLQSDLGVLEDGLAARIVPPTPTKSGRAIPLQDTMEGTLVLGLAGHADARTIDLYCRPTELLTWARPGVAAQLEIVTAGDEGEELAIPLAAVQRDGLRPVIFRRAPDDRDQAIRLDADLGRDDGRWVQVLSGLRDGDEVVLDGAFQLMLATSGTTQKGGHFHADGTFHEGDH